MSVWLFLSSHLSWRFFDHSRIWGERCHHFSGEQCHIFFLFTPRSIHCFFVCLFLSPADGVSHFNRRLWQMREQPGAVRSICHVPNTHSFRRVDYICKLTPLLTVTQRLGFLEIFCYHFLVAATWGSLLFQARVSIGWILNPWAANPGYRSHHRLWCLQKKTEPQLWLLLQKPY